MNTVQPPIIQPPLIREKLRREAELAAVIGEQLEKRGFAPMGTDPLKDATVHIFARYCELLIERLNRVPQSYHGAFLRMLGATPAPAIPAWVPLTFTPVKSTQNFTAIVPRSTQVSAPAEDKSDPLVIFETIKDLTLVQAELKRAIAVNTYQLIRADVNSILSTEAAASSTEPAPLADAIPLERVIDIGQPAIIGVPKLTRLRLKLELDRPVSLPSGCKIEWGIPSEADFMPLMPELDSTAGLTQSGELVFAPPEKWPSRTIASETMPWLTCRLRSTALLPFAPDQNKAYSALINRIEVLGYRSLDAVPPTGAFYNGVSLDVSRDFFPLGERPRFGDVFYLLSEIFAAPGTKIVLDIKLTNPSGAMESPIPPVSKKGNPRLRWDIHTASGWVALDCTDGTLSLTQDGSLEFQVPEDAKPTMLNGIDGGWIRARLIGGSYAAEETPANYISLPPMSPPAIAAMHLISIQELGPMPPECLIVESDLAYRKMDAVKPFNPFPAPAEEGFMLYLGLSSLRGASALDGQTLSLYFLPWNGGRRVFREEEISFKETAMPRWQVLTASGWRDCKVNDTTRGSRRPGIIEVQLPDGLSKWQDSILDPERQFFWLRIVRNAGNTDQPYYPRRLLLNTVLAAQTLRLTDELLGSSNGRPQQIFYTLRKPVIGSATLQVREPVTKTDEQTGSGFETTRHSPGAINVARAPGNEEWISWSEVEDFSASDSHSRHYILDRLTGSVRFGDGVNGRIPPSGANNIRLHEYHTGGGIRGNRPVATVTQLHTTIPYVESVINHEPAASGQDQEDFDSLNRGAVTFLRHRDRAVGIDDYADLANKASPEVARAKCVPACHVQGTLGTESKLGSVCVIVVPKSNQVSNHVSDEMRPQPSFDLLKNVKEFLDHRRPIGVDLTMLGPEYVSIGVTAELAWARDQSTADALAECEKRLNRFLHPITGGPDGLGWEFGQRPHASDFYPLLGGIEGLGYIRALEVRYEEERPGLLAAGSFLICPGRHEIRIC
ncbi:putative baseplate assembly protein [Nitrosovibrio tenuis]|uniref:Putative baseplate assembly protein n=1 Tax=Nitrosovibrio tenuis TaxID=1233 RepID=A0A1H7MNF6_9PROT|nr:putative baseplate assembly protein [Nitrosovibrio tenuis]SEL12147.1 putative baseplate assembly protein [Nitrosovibrio tenuis]